MSLLIPLLAVTLSGFVALSFEILLFRVYAFVSGGTAGSFAIVLGVYLGGIAVGSFVSRFFCRDAGATGRRTHLVYPAVLMVLAAVVGWLIVPTIGWWVTKHRWLYTLPAVAALAALLGAVLPLVAHFGIAPDERAGERLSWLYLGNIVGSASGSLLTGFVLLDHLSIRGATVTLTLVALALALFLFAFAGLSRRAMAAAVTTCLLLGAVAAGNAERRFDGIYEKLLYKRDFEPGDRFAHVVENRSGVITVSRNHTVYGGGIYDGGFNVSPLVDHNMIIRAYALAGMHPAPKDVLMIGLSSGSWAQVIANNPAVERFTVVEINPGYLELIARYDQVKSLLHNPKVEIVIDDGRRWLMAHPERRFDAIVQNTTYHWRGQITNLLSMEYHALVKAHLKAGGLFFYNTTSYAPAQRTACTAFRHGFRLINFMAVSDAPLSIDRDRFRAMLERYAIDGKRVFDLTRPGHRARLDEMLHLHDKRRGVTDGRWFETCASVLARTGGLPVITDDNMLSEWYRPWTEVEIYRP